MGNRFREKVVEEGLDGMGKEEVILRAKRLSPAEEGGAHKTGNRRRQHPESNKELEPREKEHKEQEQKPTPEPKPEPEKEVDMEVEEGQEENRGNGRGGKVANSVAKVLGGDILSDKFVLRQIPLMLLCMVFLLLVVATRYGVENLIREKMEKENRLIELREQRIQILKSNQETVKISQIAEDLKETGVGITSGPPYEI